MDKVEEVKKILECESDLCLDPPSVGADDCGYESHSLACLECQAKQICQLFEPKPDEGRLLTDEIARQLLAEWIAIDKGETRLQGYKYHEEAQELADYIYTIGYRLISFDAGRLLAKDRCGLPIEPNTMTYFLISDQDAKTASIKDAECFSKMDEAEHGAYNAGREDMQVECQARIEALQFEIMEYFRNYVRQWEKKGIEPTFGCIWDMIRCAGKEDFKATHLKGGK